VTGLRVPLTRALLLLLLAPALAAEEPSAAGGDAGSARPNAARTEPEKQRPMSGLDSRDQALVRQNPEVMRWLEADDGRFPVMETAAASANARGTVVLVADAGQSPAQGLAGELHRVLSALGWHVMSLGLPPLPLPARPKVAGSAPAAVAETGTANPARESAAADDAAAETEDSAITIDLAAPEPSAGDAERFEARARGRIDTALGALQGRPSEAIVLVGIGLGAAPLTHYLALAGNGLAANGLAGNGAPGGDRALVWILPRFQGFGLNGKAESPATWLPGMRPWPILDIVDSRYRQQQAEARRIAMVQLDGEDAYRQDAFMLARNGAGEAGWLGHRIHGWVVRQFE
jgi:hypothetical protein